MAAWRAASPYRAIGIYIGGNNRGCTQGNLTPDWVRTEVAAGWHLIPLYVGPQASGTGAAAKKNLINNASPAALGASTATDAVNQEITAIGDLTGDGYPDLMAAQTSNHDRYLYPGKKGSKLGTRKLLFKGGWNTMSELAGAGDFDRDGYPDLAAVQKSTGALILFRGTGSALRPGLRVATGFGGRSPLL
jgi:hypothetical protein